MRKMGIVKIYVCTRCNKDRLSHMPKYFNGSMQLFCNGNYDNSIPPEFVSKTGYIKTNGTFVELPNYIDE